MTFDIILGGLDRFIVDALDFTREHAAWAPAIAFLVAFSESFAFISLLIPGWAVLIGIGALIGVGGIELWPTWLGATAGAFLGDWISYLIGYYFEHRATRVWPFSNHPQLVLRGHAFFKRWGAWAVVIGRFFGPLRAVVPLIAGIFAMPWLQFQVANVTSAMVWAFVLLAPMAGFLRRFLPS